MKNKIEHYFVRLKGHGQTFWKYRVFRGTQQEMAAKLKEYISSYFYSNIQIHEVYEDGGVRCVQDCKNLINLYDMKEVS